MVWMTVTGPTIEVLTRSCYSAAVRQMQSHILFRKEKVAQNCYKKGYNRNIIDNIMPFCLINCKKQ